MNERVALPCPLLREAIRQNGQFRTRMRPELPQIPLLVLRVDFFFVALTNADALVTEPDASVLGRLRVHEQNRGFDATALGAFFAREGCFAGLVGESLLFSHGVTPLIEDGTIETLINAHRVAARGCCLGKHRDCVVHKVVAPGSFKRAGDPNANGH